MTERFAKDHLKSFVERIERLEEEKKTIADDIKDVFAEAKGNGFDVKVLRKVIQLRKQDVNERAEQEAILETYLQALGMLREETVARVEAIDKQAQGARSAACAADQDRIASPPFGDAGKAPGITASADAIHSDGGGRVAPLCRGRATSVAPSPEGTPGPSETQNVSLSESDQAAPALQSNCQTYPAGGSVKPIASRPAARRCADLEPGRRQLEPASSDVGLQHGNACDGVTAGETAPHSNSPLFEGGGEHRPRSDGHLNRQFPDTTGGADCLSSSPMTGGDPRPGENRLGRPGGDDDLELPAFLRRDEHNRAPFMDRPPVEGEARPPPW